MKYKNPTDKDLMVSFPPVQGRATEWATVKAGEEKELNMTEERATAQGLVVAGKEVKAPEPEAEESEVAGGPEGSVKVETKKAKKTAKKKVR